MPAPAVSETRPGATAKPGFRPDIQGLRAIAVMLVVLFHSGVQTLSGGYVGVDVFFVISGFLITTHLLETLARDGRISFGRFYAKRARRILPAALLVAALSLVAAWIWMSPLLLRSVVNGAIATALYVPNFFFALQDTDYLAETTPSVFQHYWSLGIEEQFYLVWPALLAVGFWLCRHRERRVMVLVAVVTAASFLACVAMMGISQPW
ncbi:MAG: acyltransferase, partial [Brachybacterium sp.]|nr:acyltransferase [Brachybacterium sp.]